MSVSPNRKCLAASVKIKGDEFPNLLIFNLKSYLNKGEREKVFRYTDTKSTEFSQLAFSGGDARFLVCMTGAPSYQIIFLDIARMKQLGIATLGHPISRLCINPKENHVISMSGPSQMRILRVQENQFKQLNEIAQLPMNQHFTDHSWLDESYLIVATDQGTVYIVENYEVQEIFENAFNVTNLGISALTAFSKGFIIGSEKGHLALYMKIDEYNDGVEDYKFMLKKTFMADRKSPICHIDISHKNDLAAVSFKSNDIATFELTSLLSNSGDLQKEKDVTFEYLFNGFHSGAVTSLDVCLQRPLLVTCSKYDSSIRVWNYMNFRCELARKFFVGEENSETEVNYNPLICVAFHPFGYYIAAGFVDKIRYFHLLHDQLRIYKEIVLKNCCLLRFSNGGQYLAAAFNKNKSTQYFVNIYNSYSAELLGQLKGHTGVITDLQWDSTDRHLYSIGQDGSVYMYDAANGWARQDFQSQDSRFSSMVFGERGVKYVAGEQKGKYIVREIDDKEFVGQESSKVEEKEEKEEETGRKSKMHQLGSTQLTSITYLESLKNYQAVIGGCDQGFIRVYSSIFNQKAFEVMASHHGEITKVRASPDGRYVFSGGQDGSVFIYQVSEITSDGNLVGLQAQSKDALEDNALNPRAMIVDEHLADVVLVGRAEIDRYLNKQKQLRNEIEDLENKIEQKHLDEKLKLVKDKKAAEEELHKQLEQYGMRYEELKHQKQEVEKDYSNLLKTMESNHLKAVEELENLYEKKLGQENEKYIQLENRQVATRLHQTQHLEDVKSQNRNTLDTLKIKFEEKFQEVEGLYKATRDNALDLGHTFMEKLGQQEDEYESEIESIRQNQKKAVEALMMENMNMKSRYDALGEENRQAKDKLESLEKVNDGLETLIRKQQQTIQDQEARLKHTQKELKDQQDTLRAKEKKLYEYKFKIADLQKAKHVLTFRTAEMRKSLEPKEAQIEKLKEELFKIEGEFESMLQTSQKQNEQIKKLGNQVETVEANYEAQKGQTRVKESHINRIAMDIYNCVKQKDMKDWPAEMKNLYQTYVCNQDVKQVKEDPKGIEERQRQISHLESCIDQIHVSSNNIIKRREVDIRKKTMENAILIYDLNQIRKQNKEYQTQITTKNTEIELKNNELKKLRKDVARLEKQGLSENMQRTQLQQGSTQLPQGSTMDGQHELSLPLLKQADSSMRYNQQSTMTLGKMGGYQGQEAQKKMMHLLNQQSNKKQVGKLYRGTNFDAKTLGAFDKAKILDLMTDLENGNNKIFTQENELARLRAKIQNHVIEKGCTDLTLEDMDDNTRYFQQT